MGRSGGYTIALGVEASFSSAELEIENGVCEGRDEKSDEESVCNLLHTGD